MTDAPPPQWPPQGHPPHPGQPQQPGPYAQPPQPGPHAQPGQYPPPGAQPGQYPPPGAQPGQYPPPGPYGQPGQYPPPGAQPGQYPPPGPYGQPGQYPPGAQGPWAQVPQYGQHKPKPKSGGGGHLRIIGGGFLILIMGTALMQNAHEGFDSAEGFITTALFALFLGGSLLLLLSGIFRAASKTGPAKLVYGAPIGLALLALGVSPFASAAWCEHDEAKRWEELNDAMATDALFFSGRWRVEYAAEVHEKFQRPEWHARWMLARAKENVEAKDAHELRVILQEIANTSTPSMYEEAEGVASRAFTAYSAAAKAKMYAPTRDGQAREFPVDESLRAAFATVLEQLTHAPEANVYVAFGNTVDLTPPEDTDQLLKLYQSDPSAMAAFPDGAPVIEPQQSFSPAYDNRRQATFMAAMSDSFGQVFDADLLKLVPLKEGESREGKIVIEVDSHIVRLPKFFFWEREDPTNPTIKRVIGLLFGIAVDWELKVFGPDGKQLYAQPPVRSEPAGNVSVSTNPGDPDWGMYSILMDSAYYNYSRQVTGMFGLAPPPERTVFAYQAVGAPAPPIP